MQIVHFPHPTLRHKSKPIKRVNAGLRKMVREMFDLMYEANGVGLAANQVNLPFRLFIVNLAAKPDEGEEHVFINPVISSPKGNEEREEGCLSLPGVYAPVKRPIQVTFNAYTLDGTEIEATLDGLMARVVQHETDHLDGVMFIDRLSTTAEMVVQDEVHEFMISYQNALDREEIPGEEEVLARLVDLESEYC